MKNFDNSRAERRRAPDERTFQIHGEMFVLRSAIHPSALAGYDAIDNETGIGDTLKIVDETIMAMIEPDDDAYARYVAIREDEQDPITVEDLLELVRWMIEGQTDRPTGKPGVSSPGRPLTALPSTAPSTSPVESTA